MKKKKITMQTISSFLVLATLLATLNCSHSSSDQAHDSIKETKPLVGVSALKIDGVFNLHLIQSDQEQITIEGSQELLDELLIHQEGNVLVLEIKKDQRFIFEDEELSITISLAKLRSLEYNGVGNARTDGTFKIDSLDLRGNGVGNLNLSLEANSITADFDMVGNITLDGSSQSAIFINKGIGNLDASNLLVQDLTLTSSGIGKVEVNCTGDLSLEADGIGKVSVSGDPRITNKSVSGIGKVDID